jgi:transcriptional regulator with XRE-family HTH domain
MVLSRWTRARALAGGDEYPILLPNIFIASGLLPQGWAEGEMQAMSFDTGARLKATREARKLSQRQLAAAAGVTGGMISLIEQNRTSPSVATLKKILAALDMSLGAFFTEEDDGRPQWVFRASEFREITPDGAAARFRQVGRPGASALQMLHESYESGADTGPDPYSHDGDEAGIVIEGEITLTVGGETQVLRAGDAYLFNSRTPHRFRNMGQTRCVIVSACTPPSF